jgi:hypothetical protein
MTKPFFSSTPAKPSDDEARPYVSREDILSLLGTADAAVVRAAEAAACVGRGEEYLDLHHLDRGVRRASGRVVQIGNVVPKSAVGEHLWGQILACTP